MSPRRAWALLLSAGLGLGPLAGAQEPPEAPRTLLQSRHARRVFERPVLRMAVADDGILGFQLLSGREVLLLGRRPGTTSLIVWFEDGTVSEEVLTVQRDLTLLQQLLHEIHPAIQVASAPDRPAIVLRGTVPDLTYLQAAETAAAQYLAAQPAESAAGALLVRAPGDAPAPAPGQPEPAPAPDRVQVRPGASAAVINLLRVLELPPRAEERLLAAIRGLSASQVRVRRVRRGTSIDDERDTFVLEGQVDNQVALTRILTVAARALGIQGRGGLNGGGLQIQVLGDEAGALPGGRSGQNQSGAGGGAGSGGGAGFGGGAGLGGPGGRGGLQSQIQRNVGRAKVLSVGDGRLLSFLEVRDLPQVRVEVQFFEINRSRLMNYSLDVNAVAADFFPGSLVPFTNPPVAAPALTGSVSPADVQGVARLLTGAVSQRVQVADDRWGLDATLQLLETEGVARSLSAPVLTVLSGELANVTVGGDVPIPVSFAPALGGGAAAAPGVFNGVEFREFGIQLAVRPLVGDDDTITLDVVPTVSRPDPGLTAILPGSAPTVAFETRSLRTSTRLGDGHTLLVGGLITRSASQDASYPPLLHRIPLLDQLLTSWREAEDDLELVVLVTPTLVRQRRPASPWAVPAERELMDRLRQGLERRRDGTSVR